MKRVALLGLVLVLVSTAIAAQPDDDIGYPTVQAALDALRGNPAARLSVRNGWTIIEITDGEGEVQWSFTPADHPAHPSVVKRTVVEHGDEVSSDTRVRCEAAPAPCDRLFEEFVKIGEQIPRNPRKTPTNTHRP